MKWILSHFNRINILTLLTFFLIFSYSVQAQESGKKDSSNPQTDKIASLYVDDEIKTNATELSSNLKKGTAADTPENAPQKTKEDQNSSVTNENTGISADEELDLEEENKLVSDQHKSKASEEDTTIAIEEGASEEANKEGSSLEENTENELTEKLEEVPFDISEETEKNNSTSEKATPETKQKLLKRLPSDKIGVRVKTKSVPEEKLVIKPGQKKTELKTNQSGDSSTDKAKVAKKEIIKEKPKDPIFNLPVYRNKRVDSFIRLYTVKKRKVFQRGLNRSAKYMKMIHRIFDQHGIPRDLAYLAAVESNYNSVARSHAAAVGLWQFIAGTGKIYDLSRSYWHDDRLDPEKSTHAAARYLKYLYKKFGKWELALAAYNSGSGWVRKATRRNRRAGKPTDYWSLKLPRETRGYVPAFMAVSIIFRNLEEYGFKPVTPLEEEKKRLVNVPGGISIKQFAKVFKASENALLKMNPGLKMRMTPPGLKKYKLFVPAELKTPQNKFAQLKFEKVDFWMVHRVVRGDTLWDISRKYNVPVRKIKEFNGLGRKRVLSIGVRLRMPVPKGYAFNRAKLRKTKRRTKLKYNGIVHYVKKGDNFWNISRAYGVSIRSLKRLNRRIARRRFLQPGMPVKIPKRKNA